MDHKPGASPTRDFVDHQAPGERTEHGIDGFIASRPKQRARSEGERPEEPPWGRALEALQRPRMGGKRRPAVRDHRDRGARLGAVMASLLNCHRRRSGSTDTGPRKGRHGGP
jgi:hypothetical protein